MKKYLLILIVLILFISCKSEDEPEFSIDLHNGFFVTNEGPFQNGTGTITFISNSGEVTQEVFQKVNYKVLGNIVQSMTLYQDRAFIVVNNSHKIVVTERYSLKEITQIEGDFIQNPRYLKVVNGFAYVSNWGNPQDPNDDFIAVLDLSDYSLVTKISVGEGPEKMLVKDNQLYVLLQGGFGFNNKLSIIDCNNNSVISTIEVGDVPTGIVQDSSGFIWVLCSGIPSYAQQISETGGEILKINNYQIVMELAFQSNTTHPKNLTISNNILYYTINENVYQHNTTSSLLSEEPIEELQGNYYTLKAHNNKLYGTDPTVNFNDEGKLKIFSLESYTLLHEFKVGIIPGDIIFQN